MAASSVKMFPNDPIFTRLLKIGQSVPDVVISDKYGIEAGYEELFDDIAHFRRLLKTTLPSDAFDSRGLLQPEYRHIASMTASIYHFVVGFLTIVSLGGACVPLSNTGTLEEMAWALQKVNASSVLLDPWTADLSATIRDCFQGIQGQAPRIIEIQRAEKASNSLKSTIDVDEKLEIPESQTCMIMFSSGTTGKPKGVCLPRRSFYLPNSDNPQPRGGVALVYQPVYWMSGAHTAIINVLAGSRSICLRDGARTDDIWEALRAGNVTSTSIPPMRLKFMRQYYYSNICQMSPQEHDSYVAGISKLKILRSSGSVLDAETTQFWKDLANLSIITVFASTEIAGPAFRTGPDSPHLDSCIGELIPNVTAKLSDGDRGELLLKTPGMFTHYVGNEEATKAAFDEEGFYRTGDVVRRDGDQYFFLGRSSIDFIRFSAFSVSVLELETRLQKLPYISEAYVLPIMDYEARELVAAVVRPKDAVSSDEVNLQKIRDDLSLTTEPYKLPWVLRVLQEGETIPMTASEKARKIEIREKFFKLSGYLSKDYAVPGVEFWGGEIDSTFFAKAKQLPPGK